MSKYKKPLPEPRSWSKEFWEAAKMHELIIQQCGNCKQNIFYPQVCCPNCLSTEDLRWIKASGKGKVYSFSVVYANPPLVFKEDVPYVPAIIELEEGIRLFSNIVGCVPEEVKCDMPVEVAFDDVTEEFTLPKFKPAAV